ncbi:hypothetical protein EGW08_001108 [Elysia chlorotica]|uniref:Putative nuclease HARBI1 n=1 Tax=Elysia chlorotica TaxID=188477 RepID=A0A3S1BX92_ELYCH|nr:hypothetical protein EGW08_001108 [Elysia chlorotica]
MADEVEPLLMPEGERGGVLPVILQVCLTLRYLITGNFQDAVGEMIGVSQSTVSRTVRKVLDIFLVLVPRYIRAPTQQEANFQKRLFSEMAGFPGVFACIDGTHVRIQRPRDDEADYVNRKNFHSLNVQIVCNSDMLIMDCVARHPGSAHDARILRESNLFAAMEGQPRQLQGLILGDSGYPVREWLMTPFLQPSNAQQEAFNLAHRQTRVTVERCVGVLKRRFHSLHTELRLEPAVASRVVYACCMLHNKATMLGLNDDEPIDEGCHPYSRC